MFFNKNEPFSPYNQAPTMINMVNDPNMPMDMPYEGYMPGSDEVSPDLKYSQTEMGYACDPYGYCGPYCEHTEFELDEPEAQVYVVKKGDSVYKIAQKYGMDWRELAGYNHLGNPDLIYPGQRLFIPPRY